MDKVYIRGLEVETVIGIYDWERRAPQRLVISVEMDWDIRPAARSEDIEAALNYKSVAQRLIEQVRASRCQLVETLAEQLAELILSEFGVPRVRLELAKPGAIGEAQAVGVIIERNGRSHDPGSAGPGQQLPARVPPVRGSGRPCRTVRSSATVAGV